jgi:hypothetical protein
MHFFLSNMGKGENKIASHLRKMDKGGMKITLSGNPSERMDSQGKINFQKFDEGSDVTLPFSIANTLCRVKVAPSPNTCLMSYPRTTHIIW